MSTKLKKTLAGAAAMAVVASVAPFIGAGVASAATNNVTLGALGVSPATGDSSTNITLSPTLNNVGVRTVTDGTLTVGSATLTSATANFTADDLWRPVAFSGSPSVSGAVAPAGSRIVAVNSATSVTLSLSASGSPANGTSFTMPTTNLQVRPAACPGDTAGAGWRWQAFLVPSGANLDTLTFDGNGPVAQAGAPGTYTALLSASGGTPLVNQPTNVSGTGQPGLFTVPQVNFSLFLPGDVAAGTYKIGVACTQSGATQTYWNRLATVTTTSSGTGGPAQFTYALGAQAPAPTLTASAGNGSVTVDIAPPVGADPGATSYQIYLNGTPSGSPITGSAGFDPAPVTITSGITNGTPYTVTATASNGVGSPSAQSAGVTVTPALPNAPAVQNLTATDQSGSVRLNWAAYPGAQSVPAGSTHSGFTVDVSQGGTPVGSQIVISDPSATSYTYNGAAGAYTFTVTPTFTRTDGQTQGADAATVSGNSLAGQLVQQVITVSRPNGALVLTQVCGRYGDLPVENPGLAAGQAGVGFPAAIPAATAVDNGVAPTRTPGDAALTDPLNIPTGQPADNQFAGYPYPDDANGLATPNYPTVCNVAMPAARLVDTGPENLGKGKFFATTARLNQVTVVDTRDTDPGWNIGASVTDFLAPGGKSFSGNQLGWTPVMTDDTDAFQDALNNTYDQVATAGSPVLQNTLVTSDGLKSGAANTLIRATGRTPGDTTAPIENTQLTGTDGTYTGGLGIAIADARLKLAIPVTAMSGNYTAILTISVI